MLQWVLVDGSIRHVLDFKGIPPHLRPLAFCPECEKRLTLKIGPIRIHHAAHQPNDVCKSTNPETALHINAKFHLARELRSSDHIITSAVCRNSTRSFKPCRVIIEAPWPTRWSSVSVETKLHTRRPDILLSINGTPVGAIEVFVKHKVSPDKAVEFQKLSIPWLEVRGIDILPTTAPPWLAPSPLPIINDSHSGDIECQACRDERIQSEQQAELYILQRQQKEDKERERQSQDFDRQGGESAFRRLTHTSKSPPISGREIIAYRFVDHFFKTENRIRDIFIMFKDVHEGQVVQYGYYIDEEIFRIIRGTVTSEGKNKISDFFKVDSNRHRDARSIAHHRWIPAKEWMKANSLSMSELAYRPQLEWNRYKQEWGPIRDRLNGP